MGFASGQSNDESEGTKDLLGSQECGWSRREETGEKGMRRELKEKMCFGVEA